MVDVEDSGAAVGSRSRRSGVIGATPDEVWPWLVQMGFDRGGWYAVDALERAFGVGRFATGGSARRVEPALQDLAVGDRIPLSRRSWLAVARMERPRVLELRLPPGRLGWTWRFELEPTGTRATRLTIVTELSVPARSPARRVLVRMLLRAFDVGHGVMERVQLRTLARRVPAGAGGAEGGDGVGGSVARPPARPPARPSTLGASMVTGPDVTRLQERARAWAAGDPDPSTRAELEALADAGDPAVLAELVDAQLAFGTAGLRGRVGPGPNRMNRAVVIRTTRGLVDHLLATDATAATRGVVVAFDARTDSERFARDVAAVAAAAGVVVHRFPTHQPTPIGAYAQKALDAAACVVVTASHNPPEDNGYKVYVEGAAQIVPPTDAAIAAAIDAVGAAAEVPRIADGALDADPHVRLLGDELVDRYLAELPGARPAAHPRAAATPLRIAYTPLHGVGRDVVLRALADGGHDDVHVAPTQAEPDGTFPTVAFPNPEEPGALDAVLALAREVDADLVLANDPDADRLAVAVPDRDGGFVPLSGNRIGVLLAEHCLAGRSDDVGGAVPLVVSSIVSTPMVGSIAAAHGARSEVTLTGFKWICAAARALVPEGHRSVYGFEEALGSSVGDVVADKDGISAAVVFADLTRAALAEGRTVLDLLDELHRRHGLWVSRQRSVVLPGLEGGQRIAAAMDALGERPPNHLGGAEVRRVTDYRRDVDRRPQWLGAHDLVACELDEGRVMIRPSGTEPKVKVYVDVRRDVAPDASADDLAAVEASLGARADELAEDLLRTAGLLTAP